MDITQQQINILIESLEDKIKDWKKERVIYKIEDNKLALAEYNRITTKIQIAENLIENFA